MHKLICWGVLPNIGVWWVRILGAGVCIKSPRRPPLFSERYGYQVPFMRFRGWRFFWLKPVAKTV